MYKYLLMADIVKIFGLLHEHIPILCKYRKDGVWVGHLLSGYSLPMEDPSQSKAETNTKEIGGTWREAIKVGFEATQSAFPGGEILAHLDHK